MNLSCPLIDFKLSTYNHSKVCIQSQTLSFLNLSLKSVMNGQSSIHELCIQNIALNYSDLTSQKKILTVLSKNNSAGMVLKTVFFTEIKKSNEIEYKSQEIEAKIDLACISHFLNFISLKDLSAKDKTVVFDKLKTIQESAMNTLSDIFYYEKTYYVRVKIPKISVSLNAAKGQFFINLKDLTVNNDNEAENSQYSSVYAGVFVEAFYEQVEILSLFEFKLGIKTLAKRFLKIK